DAVERRQIRHETRSVDDRCIPDAESRYTMLPQMSRDAIHVALDIHWVLVHACDEQHIGPRPDPCAEEHLRFSIVVAMPATEQNHPEAGIRSGRCHIVWCFPG